MLLREPQATLIDTLGQGTYQGCGADPCQLAVPRLGLLVVPVELHTILGRRQHLLASAEKEPQLVQRAQ